MGKVWAAALAVVIGAGIVVPACLLGSGTHNTIQRPPPMKVDGNGVLLEVDAPQWRYVELAVAREGEPLAPLPSPGRVAFDEMRTSAVGTPLAGRVERVLVRVGDRIERGARLFSVRSGAWADLDKEVEATRSSVSVKTRLAQRARELVQLQAIPEKDLFAAEAELHEAELALQAAQAKLDSLKVSGEANNLFWVVSPRKGTVVELDVSANQEATPDREKPLLRIADLDEVLVLADVQERDAADIAPGTEVEVRSQAGEIVRSGVVQHVSEVVDAARRTVEVRVRVGNSDRALRPNGFAEITFKASTQGPRVRVPADAVVTDGSRSVVFVAQGEGRLERVPVKPGRQRDGEVELLSGLSPGSRFVAKGALLLLNQIELAE
jgi:cobalt-zinc-cadmium efflux system membrane fusion protein